MRAVRCCRGDVIVELDGTRVSRYDFFRCSIATSQALEIKLVRDGLRAGPRRGVRLVGDVIEKALDGHVLLRTPTSAREDTAQARSAKN
jgi:hypothetical protein